MKTNQVNEAKASAVPTAETKPTRQRKAITADYDWPPGRKFFLHLDVSNTGRVRMDTNGSVLENLGLLEGMRAILRLQVLNAAASAANKLK